ncbi:crotonobetainyl-CoA:carnitine CoA-transferase CaiB-like acyl-CoA transferase [Paraburkholderia sp. Kb1A]|uniref:CoA transferase n=2 Tax=Burkholderiaceae TaxID=119060 RepID=A0ABR7PIJ3_9BURK|nr:MULTISPECIES: CoA transferase [unclassified Paraburkholderia]MBB5448797.1 crotonobetainyl-CoA:carnitine CoA-transferase CaiB-like acyl-CoA transferase [Paraburkholderia sp. Kb1A]MBC8746001.1 CoA transferase [Paraburkholderia podalyriae]
MAKVLEGIRVLDFGRYIAGPFCAALLGDFGADVIRIDRIGGSEDRFVMPVTEGGEGAVFLQSNRNKRSLTLDIDCPQGREVAQRLIRTADVVVANMPPKTLANLGLDYESLCAVKPDIVLTASSAFGTHADAAHRVGFDGVGQAMSGAVYLSGMPNNPAKAMVPVVDFATAMSCALGTVMALYERRKSGKGQVVEGSLLQTALTFASGVLIEESVLSLDRQATGNRSPSYGPSDIFRTADGWIIAQVIGQSSFKRWAHMVGAPELIDDPRFSDDVSRGENGQILSEMMSQWCAARNRAEALDALEKAKIPAGPVYSPREALDDPVVRASKAFDWVDYPGLSRSAPIVLSPTTLSRTPPTIESRPPTIGEHTTEVLREVGYSDSEIAALRDLGVA